MMNRSSFYREQSQSISQYKIIILGLSGTGKTSLLTLYQQDFYDDRGTATLSVDYNITKRPQAWYFYYDTCGQEAYRAIVSHYYKGSDACIIAYDVSNPQTYHEISYYYNQVKEQTPDALLYIIGCKADLQRKVFEEDLAKNYKGIKHFVTSAKTKKGVHEAFAQIQKDLLQMKPKLASINRSRLKPIDFQNTSTLDGKRGKGSSCCKN